MVAVTTLLWSRPYTEPIAWELRHSAYVEVARRRGDEGYAARQSYSVVARPSELRLD